ncbi:hypothetical protein P3T73_16350 [Kiritimatiellota bacterium B12222]|nr:hypothetical protein P3T73_16350 [Kiritimatiellota bacterium B12222]
MNSTTPELWKTLISPHGPHKGVRVENSEVYWKVEEGDWIVGTSRVDSPSEEKVIEFLKDEPEKEVSWRRLASVEDVPTLKIMPAFPNRPVVVRPEYPYTLIPGERVNIFVGVPVSFCLQTPNGLTLLEETVHPLSNTWFGLPTDGELCYAMRTLARREGENLDFGPARVICPMRIRNQSKEKMTFERMCLRVQYLSIYLTENKRLCSNESSVVVRSDESWSRVAFASKAPAMMLKPTLLVQGKEDAKGTFLIKALTEGKGLFQ